MSNLKIQGNVSGAGITTLQSNNTATNLMFSLPIISGSAGQIMSTDGAGELSFVGFPLPFNDNLILAQFHSTMLYF